MISLKTTLKFAIPSLALAVVLGCGCDQGKSADPGASGGTTSPSASTDAPSGAVRPASTGEGNTVTGDTIPIGLVASENGELKPWGADCVKGAQLAVDEINAAGGIKGKKIDLKIGDSGSKPEQGKSAAEKLMDEDKVIALIGETASGITAQMAQPAQEKGIPDVAVGATRTVLSDIGNDFFRVCYTDAFQGPVMATFAYKELGLHKIALMTDKKQPYSTGLSDSFRAEFTKLGGQVVDEQFYESGQTQFTGQLTNLKAKNPDGIFMSGYFTETGPIARQAREQGIKGPLLGGDGWDSSEILKTGGDAILGQYFCNHYNNYENRPEVQDFLKKWKAKYPNDPGGVPATTMGALGYDATKLVCDALSKSKGLDSKDLRDALDDEEGFKGVTGIITLKGNNGNPPKRALVVQLDKNKGQVFAKAYEPGDISK